MGILDLIKKPINAADPLTPIPASKSDAISKAAFGAAPVGGSSTLSLIAKPFSSEILNATKTTTPATNFPTPLALSGNTIKEKISRPISAIVPSMNEKIQKITSEYNDVQLSSGIGDANHLRTEVVKDFPFTETAKDLINKGVNYTYNPDLGATKRVAGRTGTDNPSQYEVQIGKDSPPETAKYETFHALFNHAQIDPLEFNKAWDKAKQDPDNANNEIGAFDDHLNDPELADVFKDKGRAENIDKDPYALATERFASLGLAYGNEGISAVPKELQPYYRAYLADKSQNAIPTKDMLDKEAADLETARKLIDGNDQKSIDDFNKRIDKLNADVKLYNENPSLTSAQKSDIIKSGGSILAPDNGKGLTQSQLPREEQIRLAKEQRQAEASTNSITSVVKGFVDSIINPDQKERDFESLAFPNTKESGSSVGKIPVLSQLHDFGTNVVRVINRITSMGSVLKPVAEAPAANYIAGKVSELSGRDDLSPAQKDQLVRFTELLSKIDILKDSNSKVVGDIAIGVLGTYMPGIVEGIFKSAAVDTVGRGILQRTPSQLLTKGAIEAKAADSFFKSYGKSFVQAAVDAGVPFGAAQSIQNGTADPQEIAKIMATNVIVAGVFSLAIRGGADLTEKSIALIRKGIEIHKSLPNKQGGFMKLPFSEPYKKTDALPNNEKAAPLQGELLKTSEKINDKPASQPLEVASEQIKSLPTPKTSNQVTFRYNKEVLEPRIAEGKPKIIGADDMKDHFGKDYDTKNHLMYSKAAFELYNKVLKTDTNPVVRFTAGGPGSGKTELLMPEISKGFDGIIYDSNLSNFEGAKNQIQAARNAGKSVEIYGIIPRLETAHMHTVIRGAETGREVSDSTFAKAHSKVPDTLAQLLKEGIVKPEEVKILDTRKIKTAADIKNLAKKGEFAADPLALLSNLGYREDTIAKIVQYERTKTNIKAGRDINARGPEKPVPSSAQDRADNTGKRPAAGGGGRILRSEQGAEVDPYGAASRELSDAMSAESGKAKSAVEEVKANKENREEIKSNIADRQMEKAIIEDSVMSDPARQLSKYANKKTGELPEVTGDPTSIFATKGDDIVTELGFKDSEEARAAYEKYTKNRDRYLKTQKNLSEIVKDYRDKKEIIDAVTKDLRREGRNRAQKIDSIQSFFNLTDDEMRPVLKGTPDFRLMTEARFEEILKGIQGKAYDAFLLSEARAKLEYTIFQKELVKVDNLRQAMKLPEIQNMSRKQLLQFNELLRAFKTGDEFLGVRQIQTIKNTNLANIKTKREALEDIAKRTGVPYTALMNIKIGEFDKFLYDVALARKNPFYQIMVEDTSKALANANVRLFHFKETLGELLREARASRKRGVLDRIAPTDDMIFDFLDSDAATKLELAKRMTPEELDAARFVQDRYAAVRDYLVNKGQLDKYRVNYITHIQRPFIEAIKQSLKRSNYGIGGKPSVGTYVKGVSREIAKALGEVLDIYKQEEANFRIMNNKTGEVLPLEKFFRFSLMRTGEKTPTKNVGKAVIAYMSAFEKKAALDSIVPKIDVYAHSLTPSGMTKRGLELDASLKSFVKSWLNSKRGRPTEFIFKPGGKMDWAVRSGVAFTRILDLGLNVPVGLASNVGEQIATMTNIGFKKTALGAARALTPQGRKIAKNYGGFVGERLIDKLRDTSASLGDKFSQGIFGLFSSAARRANVEHLLGSMTPEEFAQGKVSPERLGKLRLEIGKYRSIEQAESIAGKSVEGQAWKQYKSWAVPMLHTTLNNIKVLLKQAKGLKVDMESPEFQELLRATILYAAVGTSAYGYYAHLRDKKDRNFLENLGYKSMNDAFSMLGALDPSLWSTAPRLVSFLGDLGKSISNIAVSLATGERDSKGDVKGVNTLKSTVTPSIVRQLTPDPKTNTEKDLSIRIKAQTKDAKDLRTQAVELDQQLSTMPKEEANAKAADIKRKDPALYAKLKTVASERKLGLSKEESLMKSLGIANGARADYLDTQIQKLGTSEEKNAYVKNLREKGIITTEVLKQLQAMKGSKPQYDDKEEVTKSGLISDAILYAKAIGTDPVTAFNRIFTGQAIRRIDNGALIVERMQLADSEKEATRQLSATSTPNLTRGMVKLDHTIPLELGGSNSRDNLRLVLQNEWKSYSPIENYLGALLRKNKITKAEAQKAITDFKTGKLSAAEVRAKFQ